jgi:hypothetical protein
MVLCGAHTGWSMTVLTYTALETLFTYIVRTVHHAFTC